MPARDVPVPPRVSYAQNGEDVRLWRVLDAVEDGFYVEVGGWEPELDSISFSFYDRGWSGVVVEPVAEYAERFREVRPRDLVVQCLAGDTAAEQEFTVFPGTGLSTTSAQHAARHIADGLDSRKEVLPVRTLDEILRDVPDAQPIHFLVIDAEGAEAAVLRGLDLHRRRPWIVIVEATEPRSTNRVTDWEPLLTSRGYRLVTTDGLNDFFVAEEHSQLAEKIEAPPNALDDFTTIHMVALRADRDQAKDREGQAHEQLRETAAALEASRLEVSRTAAALAECQERAAAAQTRADQAEQAAADLQARLDAMRSTKSWKITAPLRMAREKLGG